MKSTRTILHLALLLLGLYACDNRPFPHAMQVADSLANTAPDSAITLLQQNDIIRIYGTSGVLALQKQAKSDTEQLRTPTIAPHIYVPTST